MADGDFNLATLWVSVVPETSKLGPALEDAGKEGKKRFGDGIKDFGHTITDDLEKVSDKAKDTFSHLGSSIKDTFSRSGSDAARGFESQFDAGSLGETIGQVLGTELGATLGEAIRQIPGMDTATTIFHDLGDSIISIKNADLAGVLGTVATTLHDLEPVAKALGIDISGLPGPVQDTANKVATLAGNFGDAKKGVNQFADTVSAVSPGIADALGKWAGPIAAVTMAIDEALPALERFFGIANDPSLAAPHKGDPSYDQGTPDPWKNPADRPKVDPKTQGDATPTDVADALNDPQVRASMGLPPIHRAGGGGIGPSGTDTVPAWLTPGEFVIKKSTVDKYGMDFMKMLNASGFDGGGPVDDLSGGLRDVGSDKGLTPTSSAVKEVIATLFPQITDIGGWRPPDGYNEHSSGHALDVMIPNWNTPQGQALGDQIKNFVLSHAKELGVDYALWQQTQWNPGGGSSPMENRGDPNQNHFTHVHIHTTGGGGTADQDLAGMGGSALSTRGSGSAGAGALGVPTGAQHDPLYVMQADAGTGAGAGGSQTQSQGQQLGQGLVDGLLQSVGLDGSVFKTFGGSSNPLQFGITQLATGMANVFGGMLNQQQGGGSLGGGGGGGSILPGLGGLIPHPGVVPVGPGGAQNVNTGDTHVYQGPVTVGPQMNVTQNGVQSPTSDLQGAANAGAARGQSTYGAGILPAGQ